MSQALAIIAEVESALQDAPSDRRSEVLRRVTDLFVSAADSYTEEQIAMFDGVMEQLVRHVECRALAELSRRLAPHPFAPPAAVRNLARHDDIDVAGPVLAESARLTDDDLIEITQTGSQSHLARIARRSCLNAAVTDALVDYCDADVADTLANNRGAQFSKLGMAKMVMRADGDDRLALSIGARNDIPPQLFQQLVAQATDIVRLKLLANASPDQRGAIVTVLADIAERLAPKRVTAHSLAGARRLLAPLAQDTTQFKAKVIMFANEKRLPETIAGLAILGQLVSDEVERLLFSPNTLGLVVLCKALAFDWMAAEPVISANPIVEQFEQDELDDIREQYAALSVNSAQRLLRFWQGRQSVARMLGQSLH